MNPGIDRFQPHIEHPTDGRDAAALQIHPHGLAFDLLRVVMAVTLRGVAMLAVATAIGLLPPEIPYLGIQLEPQWGSASRGDKPVGT